MFSKAMAGLAIVLVVASSARADHKIIGETRLPEYAFCSLRIDSKAAVSWKVVPAPVRKQVIDRNLVFSGKPGIVYTVYATVIDFDKKEFEEADVEVTFGKEPGPGPSPVPPGPVPPIPVPVDPLATAIRDAATKDAFPRVRLADLGDGMKAVVKAIDSRDTGGDIKKAATTLLAASIGGTVKAPNLLAVLSKEVEPLNTIFPTDETPATPERKEAAKAIFSKLATACEGAAK